jgi:hypothetical protein
MRRRSGILMSKLDIDHIRDVYEDGDPQPEDKDDYVRACLARIADLEHWKREAILVLGLSEDTFDYKAANEGMASCSGRLADAGKRVLMSNARLVAIDHRITLAEFWWCGYHDVESAKSARTLTTDAVNLMTEVRVLRELLFRSRAEADECVRRGHADCHSGALCDAVNVDERRYGPDGEPEATR